METTQIARKTVTGDSSTSKEWGERFLKGVQEELDYNRRYFLEQPQTYSGYTTKTVEIMTAFFAKLEELAACLQIRCEMEVPNWDGEEAHRSLFGGSMSLMGNDALVKCTFTLVEDGKESKIERNILLVPDDEDSSIGFKLMGADEAVGRSSFNEGPFLFKGHEAYTIKDGFTYPEGWDENDLKNELVSIAFQKAFHQIPHPDD